MPQHSRYPVGVVWQDAKHAALYCNEVMPCADYAAVPDDLKIDYELLRPSYRRLASEYVGPGPTEWDSFVDTIHQPFDFWDSETAWLADDAVVAAAAALAWQDINCFTFTSRGHDFEDDDRLLSSEYYEDRYNWWIDQGRSLGEPEPPQLPPPIISDAIEVQLVDMEVVDTERAPWEQIADFRRDRVSIASLRDMRLLFDDKLRGKSVEYIRDYIESKLDAYAVARKKHGFDSTLSTMQLVVNSKTAAGAGAIAAAGIITHSPAIWTTTLAASAVLELTNATLNIVGQRRSLNFWSRSAELSYIFLARQRLER
jgi:hypothetical protein